MRCMMYKKSMKNLASDMKPSEPFDVMASSHLRMPLADGHCDLCGRCESVCSGKAIKITDGQWTVDLGRCLFCRDCYESCEHIKAVRAPHYALRREDLVFAAGEHVQDTEGLLDEERAKRFRRSLSIRELDTGSCNGCEAEINAMSNKYYDMERFGLKIVASPRHADALLVTGPVTRNMLTAARKTYDAVPDGKLVIAFGTCAISGGIFVEGDVVGEGVRDTLPVDMYIVGCPPSPGMAVVSLIKALGQHH